MTFPGQKFNIYLITSKTNKIILEWKAFKNTISIKGLETSELFDFNRTAERANT